MVQAAEAKGATADESSDPASDAGAGSDRGQRSRLYRQRLPDFTGRGPGRFGRAGRELWSKIFRMRIFADENGKTNLSLGDVAGEVLVVSQFTLYADCRRGNRPSFTKAGSPDSANALYEHFVERARRDVERVEAGEFGADMRVSLQNDGPFTILLDTDEL